MRWRWLAIAAIVALLLLPAALLLRGTSLGYATPLIERQLGRILGGEVTLASAPRLRIGRQVALSVHGVTIHTAGATQPLLSLGLLSVRLQGASLLRGPAVIEDVWIADATLSESIDSEGRSSLPALVGERGGDDEGDDDAGLPFQLHRGAVDNVTLRRTDQRDGSLTELHIASFRHERLTPHRAQSSGVGTLQGQDWEIELDASAEQPLYHGRAITLALNASLAGLDLKGNAYLPALQSLADAQVDLRLQGSLPPEVAALSPLLQADTPMRLEATVSDIQPGVALDVDVSFPRVALRATGTIDEPRTADGADLRVALSAPSLRPLALSLGLAEVADMPLEASAILKHRGSRLQVPTFRVDAGEHHVTGSARIPHFPDVLDSEVDIDASGPEFALLPRLLGVASSVYAPYTLRADLRADEQGPEILDSELLIGEHRFSATGLLGGLPDFRNSALTLSAAGPRLADIGELLTLDLPATPYSLAGKVAVAADGQLTLTDTRAEAADLQITAGGELGAVPSLRGMDVSLQVETPSLAALSQAHGLQPLGDVPAQASLLLTGSPARLRVSDIRLRAAGLQVTSTRGAVHLAQGALRSDVRLATTLEDLPVLLGAYAPEALTSERYSFNIVPRVLEDRFDIRVTDLKGPAARGAVRLEIARSLAVDERTHMTADLELLSLAQMLPPLRLYRPPDAPVSVRARTNHTDNAVDIALEVSSEGHELFHGAVTIPRDGSGETILRLHGSGDDLRDVGYIEGVPDEPLAYRVDAEAAIARGVVRAEIDTLRLEDSELNGTLRVADGGRSVSADITVPRADLDRWLRLRRSAGDKTTAKGAAKRERLIPDTSLPLDLLDRYHLDLRLRTGPLGLADPRFAKRSAVDALQASLLVHDGRGDVVIEELRGSRGDVEGRLSLSRDADSAVAALDLQASELIFGVISSSQHLDQLARHTLDLSLTGRGVSLRELAASLDGRLLIVGGPGIVDESNLNLVTDSFFAQLFNALLPMLKQTSDVKAQCSVLAARANGGIVTLDPGFVFRSRRVDLTARGEIDLRSEQLRVRFDNQARRGLGISAASLVNPYLQITGSLARPTLGVDVAGSVVAGGAAVASGGLTTLAKPLIGRFLDRRNPCDTALTRWETMAEAVTP
jgi:uncharacterized protein involved in outer membrane biogenesis